MSRVCVLTSAEPLRLTHRTQVKNHCTRVTRPHKFEFSDSVSEALRSPSALEVDEEEDRLPDSLSSLQVEVGVSNIIDAHPGK